MPTGDLRNGIHARYMPNTRGFKNYRSNSNNVCDVIGTVGEGEEVVQRLRPGCHQAAAASQGQSGAADQRERHCEDTTGAPGRKSEAMFEAFSTLNDGKSLGRLTVVGFDLETEGGLHKLQSMIRSTVAGRWWESKRTGCVQSNNYLIFSCFLF